MRTSLVVLLLNLDDVNTKVLLVVRVDLTKEAESLPGTRPPGSSRDAGDRRPAMAQERGGCTACDRNPPTTLESR